MPELERTLRALAPDVDYPATPELLAGVAHPVQRPSRAVRPTRTLVIAAVGLLLAAGTAVATLAPRDPKGVTIRAVDELPATPSNEPSLRPLGAQVTLERARQLATFEVLTPAEVPRRVHYSALIEGGALTLVYPDLMITEYQGSVDPAFIGKLVTSRTRVDRFELHGHPAVWMDGAPHVMYVRDRDGRAIQETLRLAGNVLLVERGGLLIRIEGRLGRREAVRLADSLR
jgi:hypothetical protein